MGNSSTRCKPKSTVHDEAKDDTLSMSAEDNAKGENFLTELANTDKYWENLAARWDENKDDTVSKKTVCASMRGMVSQSSGYSTLLNAMQEPIKKSADAYKHFETLLNDPWMIKHHNGKVTKARLIYDEYWSLLLETSTIVNKISVESKSAIKAIDDYELDVKYKTKNKILNGSTIDYCLDCLTSWNKSCKSLNELQTRFHTLGKLVKEQQQEWKKIKDDKKNRFTKSLKSAALFFAGVIVVVGVGTALAFTGGTAAVAIGAAYFTYFEIAAIVGIGGILGGAAVYKAHKSWKQWQEWEKCDQARQRCVDISKSIKTVQKCLDKVAAGVITVQAEIGKMMGKVNEVDGVIKSVKRKQTKLQEEMKDESQNAEYICKIVDSITQDFVEIKTKLKELKNACDQCIKHVAECQQKIVDSVNKK